MNTKKSTSRKDDGDHKAPNFAPLDRDQFLTRLKTFRHVDKWTSKPSAVNEVQWAKRGWSCVGKERVACVGGCDKELVIALERSAVEKGDSGVEVDLEEDDDDDWSAKANEQLVERYADMIVTAHDEYCLWRIRGCDSKLGYQITPAVVESFKEADVHSYNIPTAAIASCDSPSRLATAL